MGRPAVLKVDIVADARKVGPGVNEAESKLGKLGSIGKKAGLAAAAGLAVAGAAAVKFGIDSVKSASDLQQSYGAVDTVFGKSAKRVHEWAAGAADSVGLAKNEYNELAAVVGSQLQGMGMAQDKSAGKTRDLIKLGSDLSATYGGTVSDAVEAVSSVLKGETDPIERYGVSIKQADITARMAAMGLDGLSGKAAKQAQATAVLSLLTDQTSKAHGQFAKQTGTLAEQQQILHAKFENVKATVGTALLPILTRLFTWLSGKLMPAAQRLGTQLATRLGPTFHTVGRFISTTLIPAAQSTYRWFVEKIAPGLRRTVQPILAGLRSAFSNVAAAVHRNEPQLRQLLGAFRVVYEFIYTKVYPVLGKVLGAALRQMGRNISMTIDVVARLVGWISSAIDKVKSLIGWLGSIHVPHISLPSWAGGAIGNLTTGRPSLSGGAPSYDRRSGWSTASLTSSAVAGVAASSAQLAPAGVTYIDARDLSTSVQVDGALDAPAVADQLQQLLDQRQRRLGTLPAFGRAS